jgi:hypothetical protein
MSELATWFCHKIVQAGRILTVTSQGGVVNRLLVELADGSAGHVQVPPDFAARATPKIGDYLVVYADGHKSWSPAATFEDGYTRCDTPARAVGKNDPPLPVPAPHQAAKPRGEQ